MSDLQILTTKRLNKLIDDTQLTLKDLKEEVTRREMLQQEHEIMDLDRHMENAELNLTSIKNFITYLINERQNKRK